MGKTYDRFPSAEDTPPQTLRKYSRQVSWLSGRCVPPVFPGNCPVTACWWIALRLQLRGQPRIRSIAPLTGFPFILTPDSVSGTVVLPIYLRRGVVCQPLKHKIWCFSITQNTISMLFKHLGCEFGFSEFSAQFLRGLHHVQQCQTRLFPGTSLQAAIGIDP